MGFVNRAAAWLVGILDAPFASLPPIVGVAAWSLVVAAAILLVFRVASDQRRLAEVKRSIHACLFELRLYSDDLGAVVRAQREVLGHNLRYLGLSLKPMAWILVPLVLLVGQLHFRYGYQGLEPGGSTLVVAELSPDPEVARPDASLAVPEGVRVESGPVWTPALDELAWRVEAERPGRYQLTVEVGGERVTKELDARPGVVRRSPRRPSAALSDQLMYPAEPPVPGGGSIRAVRLRYPGSTVGLLGLELHWMVWFFALSVVFALLLRRPLGVVI